MRLLLPTAEQSVEQSVDARHAPRLPAESSIQGQLAVAELRIGGGHAQPAFPASALQVLCVAEAGSRCKVAALAAMTQQAIHIGHHCILGDQVTRQSTARLMRVVAAIDLCSVTPCRPALAVFGAAARAGASGYVGQTQRLQAIAYAPSRRSVGISSKVVFVNALGLCQLSVAFARQSQQFGCLRTALVVFHCNDLREAADGFIEAFATEGRTRGIQLPVQLGIGASAGGLPEWRQYASCGIFGCRGSFIADAQPCRRITRQRQPQYVRSFTACGEWPGSKPKPAHAFNFDAGNIDGCLQQRCSARDSQIVKGLLR